MTKIILVSPQDCKNCAAVKAHLAVLQQDYPALAVEHIDAWSPEGEALIMQYGIMASPGIIVDDSLLAAGPVSEEKLRLAVERSVNNRGIV